MLQDAMRTMLLLYCHVRPVLAVPGWGVFARPLRILEGLPRLFSHCVLRKV